MSRVYFHSPSGEAELHGSERAYLGGLVNRLAMGFLDDFATGELEPLLSPPVLYGETLNSKNLRLWWGVGDDDWSTTKLMWRGHRLRAWNISLNTALKLGSEQIQLAARIHAQCEIYGWIAGPNRAFFADLMAVGLKRGVYRAGLRIGGAPDSNRLYTQGWKEAIDHLRARDDEPVVMSYSTNASFPNGAREAVELPPDYRSPTCGDHEREFRDEGICADCRSDYWDTLPVEERWRIGMEWLTADRGGPELKPEHFGSNAAYHFTDGVTILDLFASDRDERLERIFEATPVAVA